MKIILSPAKKMIVDTDNLAPLELPVYIDKTAEVLNWMKSKSKEELKAIWKCNDKIAEQNFNRLENMDLYNRLTPAVLAYEGIAFLYMAPSVFEIQLNISSVLSIKTGSSTGAMLSVSTIIFFAGDKIIFIMPIP